MEYWLDTVKQFETEIKQDITMWEDGTVMAAMEIARHLRYQGCPEQIAWEVAKTRIKKNFPQSIGRGLMSGWVHQGVEKAYHEPERQDWYCFCGALNNRRLSKCLTCGKREKEDE